MNTPKVNNFNYLLINEENVNTKNNKKKTPKLSYENELFNLSNFNYEGICSNPFQYKENNKRDLLFNTIFYDDIEKWKKHKKEIREAIEMSKHTIPHATKILYLYGDINDDEFEEMFTKNGYQILRSHVKIDQGKFIVSQRYLDFEKYLTEHQNEYDRVVMADLRDVFWFADGFSTISPDELILTYECNDLGNYTMRCVHFGKLTEKQTNFQWMANFWGKEITVEFQSNSSYEINGGFVGGNTKKMLSFLRIMNEYLLKHSEYLYEWGYDQATITYIYNTGKLDLLNVTTNTITQRLGYDMFRYYKYNKKLKSLHMISNGCSPIIRHKLRWNEHFMAGIDEIPNSNKLRKINFLG